MDSDLQKEFELLVRTSTLKDVNEEQIEHFDTALNYDDILQVLKEDFETKWDDSKPSSFGTLDEYELVALLGVGSYGKVRLCKHKTSKRYTAVKFLYKEHVVKHKQVQHVFNEKRVLYSTNFPFLVSLEFSRKDNDYLYLAMPFYNGGELFSYHRKQKTLSESHAKFYASQVFLGLQYMHSNDLIYRDLKPENILIDRRGYIRIADFGFTKKVRGRTMTLCGTPEYFAPELIQATPYAVSVDWWTFGIFVYELVAGSSPFSKFKNDPMKMYTKICEGKYKMPQNFTTNLQNLIRNLLEVNISKRYGMLLNGNKDIQNHEWFDSVNWFAILNQEVEPPFVPKTSGFHDTSNFEKYQDFDIVRSDINKFSDHFDDF